MSSFKINQNKIFLNNSSFVKHEEPVDDYIIQNTLNSKLLESNYYSPNNSKINSSDLYSNAMKYKKLINTEFLKSKKLANQRRDQESNEILMESLGVLQIPFDTNQKNPIANEEVSFLKFEEIEKHNADLISKDSKSLSLPRLHHKYQILKNSYEGNQNYNIDNSINLNFSPSKNKMIFDIEVTHNKEIYHGLSKKIKQEMNDSFKNMQNSIIQNKKTMIKMPNIRSYPMVKMNKISYKTNKDLEDLDSNPLNTTLSEKNKFNEHQKDNPKDPKFRIYWSLANIYTWKPEVRESASFIIDGHKGVLYGGLGTKVMSDVATIDFDTMEWEKITDSGDKYTMGKYGHSSVRFKRKMYVFGGGTSFQSQNRQKEVLSEVRSLNLDDFTWNWVKCSGDLIISRRNHTAEIVGKHMIVHGGLNYKNVVLNDVWLFDFAHHKWSQALLKNATHGLAYHSACCIYYLQRTRLEAYKGVDRKIAENNGDMIKYEGLYYFGGKNSKNEVVNNLYILEIRKRFVKEFYNCIKLLDKNPMSWFEPETFGKPPTPRCGHTMNFCPQFGLAVVIGGKDDKCLAKPFCNDICLLNLSNMNWLQIRIFGLTLIPPRAFHSSGIINSKLYIFGGYNAKGYVNHEINIVEFDAKVIREILNAEKEKKLLRQLQERIMKEKMEKHKKKNGRLASILMMKEKETLETESDEMGGSFEELSPEIDLNKQRKGGTIFRNGINQLLKDQNEEIKQGKWKTIVEKYNHQNFKSFVPLPKINQDNKISKMLKRSNTINENKDNNEEENDENEIDLESFVKKTRSEKNIKVSETLKIANKIG